MATGNEYFADEIGTLKLNQVQSKSSQQVMLFNIWN
jgi:hypothetical protein